MNGFDFLIFAGLLLGALLGFFQGVLRMVINLVSLYLAVVVAIFLYRPMATGLTIIAPNMSQNARETLSFTIILLIIVNVVGFTARDLTIDPKPAKQGVVADVERSLIGRLTRRFIISPVNHLGGLGFGFIVTCVWIGLGIILLSFVLQERWPGYDDIRRLLVSGLKTSAMAPYFAQVVAIINSTVQIWTPSGLPPIFSGKL
jgi:uncharacterized membrane protein required for colicin V production